MAQDGHGRSRNLSLVNLAWATALVMSLAVVYVLSYAPVYRWRFGTEGFPKVNPNLPAYNPVVWLIDNTVMREPLFWWAGLFGVEDALRDEDYWRRRTVLW